MEIEALEAILMDDFRAVREEVSSLEKRFSFGASLDLDLLGIDIDDNILIRGLAVATSRAKPFTATLLLVIPEDDSDVLIDCKNVFKSFGEKHILRGVSFKIRHGEAVGIIRPSGIGKSTILKIIAGLLAPDKHIWLLTFALFGLQVFQSAALFDSLTVRENVGFLLYENSRMSDNQISELVTETLAVVGLKCLFGLKDMRKNGRKRRKGAFSW